MTHPDARREMPPAAVVLLVDEAADGVMLHRFANDGSDAGDTWHQNLEEARAQAIFEFGPALGAWTALPDDTPDPAAAALRLLSSGS